MSADHTASWTIERVIDWASADLRARGFDSPRLDAELLLGHVLGCDRVQLFVDSKRPLTRQELTAYRELHKRRRRHEPVAYLRGQREFYGRSFVVDRRVLIPRPETELLVEVGLARSRQRSLCARVLDLCTGCGCVAVTLAKLRPTNEVLGSDISEEALEVARHNALRIGAWVGLVHSDLYDGLTRYRRTVDLITANPPYIPDAELPSLPEPIRRFEPAVALSAGADGMAVTRRIIAEAPAMLAPGGVLAVEVLAGTAPAVRELFMECGLSDIQTARDYGNHERVVSGRWDG